MEKNKPQLEEIRCEFCGKLLLKAKFCGTIELPCTRCNKHLVQRFIRNEGLEPLKK